MLVVVSEFLSARWTDLVLVTWRIPGDLLATQLPPEIEPDRLPGDPEGTAYVSLVAFRFLDTKVKGIGVPLHRDFPEVNLRAYVRERKPGGRRGVIFIAELVPKPAIAVIANILYHEHYRAVPMEIDVTDETTSAGEVHRLELRIDVGERTHGMSITGDAQTVVPDEASREHFFKEHEWGFGRDGDGGLVVYRVEHPVWAVYPTSLDRLTLSFDFGELYGEPWSLLDRQAPVHVAFAVGSKIAVSDREQ
jgi:hypothetical protein